VHGDLFDNFTHRTMSVTMIASCQMQERRQLQH
jgi:hypothetical protein